MSYPTAQKAAELSGEIVRRQGELDALERRINMARTHPGGSAQLVIDNLVVEVEALVDVVANAGPVAPQPVLNAVAKIADRLNVDVPWKG